MGPISRAFVVGATFVVAAVAQPARTADYFKDVEPIFRARCSECHGASQQKGGLRLDAAEFARAGGKNGPVVIAGAPEESRLFRLAAGLDAPKRMPPSGTRLGDQDLAILRSWIAAGAVWPESSERPRPWAFEKPRRPVPPATQNASWCRGELDAFVLARLEQEGLAPSPEAARTTLVRRVHLDLTGLPPKLDDVDRFLGDNTEGAYERMVDRALSLPSYGEHFARWWLDPARYADTNGYEKDLIRSQSAWRDGVIAAFNANQPFDRFSTEQLAGDLLPKSTRDQRIASGFHRNTMLNDEGGIDAEEFRVIAVQDRAATTAAVWLGLTFGCAQCHDHKYDPITQKEFYEFYAFFDQSEDNGRDKEPVEFVGAEAESLEMVRLDRLIAELDLKISTTSPELDAEQASWMAVAIGPEPAWIGAASETAVSEGGASLVRQADGSWLATGANPPTDTYVVTASVDLPRLAALRLEVLPDPGLPHDGPGRAENGSFVLHALEAHVGDTAALAKPNERVVFHLAAADYAQEGHDIESVIDGRPTPGWAIDAFKEGFHVRRVAAFETLTPPTLGAKKTITVRLRHLYGKGHNIGRFRLAFSSQADATLQLATPAAIRERLLKPEETRTPEDRQKIAEHFRTLAPSLALPRRQLASAKNSRTSLLRTVPTTMIMKERSSPRETRILKRGNFLDSGEVVRPGVPAFLPPFGDRPRNRLGLAAWLFSAEQPLVARVIANRLFAELSGHHVVATSDDFGTRGEAPSHPELLDWLATELVRLRWDLKAFARTILMSATYRQSSDATPHLLERDPENRLFARAARYRVAAETVRDSALQVSGLLDPKIGGPSVFPFQPPGIWENSFSFHDTQDRWVDSMGSSAHRRSLYTFIRRTAPYPSLMLFDATARETCTVDRSRTNTPLQALVTLNDPVFVEAAVALARTVLAAAATDDARIALAFRLCVARPPAAAELHRLSLLLADARASFARRPGSAQSLAMRAGPGDPADAPEIAAWAIIANVLLNLDETLTRS